MFDALAIAEAARRGRDLGSGPVGNAIAAGDKIR
jgi:hypothetical protein